MIFFFFICFLKEKKNKSLLKTLTESTSLKYTLLFMIRRYSRNSHTKSNCVHTYMNNLSLYLSLGTYIWMRISQVRVCVGSTNKNQIQKKNINQKTTALDRKTINSKIKQRENKKAIFGFWYTQWNAFRGVADRLSHSHESRRRVKWGKTTTTRHRRGVDCFVVSTRLNSIPWWC